jgi:hypothetical protein
VSLSSKTTGASSGVGTTVLITLPENTGSICGFYLKRFVDHCLSLIPFRLVFLVSANLRVTVSDDHFVIFKFVMKLKIAWKGLIEN